MPVGCSRGMLKIRTDPPITLVQYRYQHDEAEHKNYRDKFSGTDLLTTFFSFSFFFSFFLFSSSNNILKISEGLSDIGDVSWQIVLCLILAWVIIYLCLIKGVISSGKVSKN